MILAAVILLNSRIRYRLYFVAEPHHSATLAFHQIFHQGLLELNASFSQLSRWK